MMKRLLTLLALLATTLVHAQFRSGSALDALNDTETVRSLKEHVSYLSSAELEGRKAGS